VFLRLQSIFNLYAETYNQRQVSNQLATITNPSPELDLILNELEILGSSPDTIDQVRLAYDQMSGVQYAHVALVSEISGNQFLRRLYDPIRSVVTRHQCFENLCCEQAVDVWFEAGGGRMNIDGSRNVRGFDVDSYQLSGGVQTEIQSDVIVGLAGSYANDKLDYRKLNGHGTSHTGFAGLYGLYRPNCGYVFVDAIYGYTDTKMKRQINIGPLEYLARSKPKISQARGYIEAGYDLDSCFCSDTLIQPFVGLEVRSFRRNHVSEKGAYPLNLCIASKRKSDVLSRLGVHVTANELFCNSFLSLDLAWQYRFTNSNNTLRERFQSFGNEFKIKGRDIGRNSVDAALTFSTSLGNNWELYVEAIGEAWSNTCAYNFLGGVQYNW
jgi:outer membrane autotransporter protein